MSTKLCYVMPYYNSANMISRQLFYWSTYSELVKQNMKIILVDDGSEEKQKLDLLLPKNLPVQLELYEVLEDIPWNECGANNLGFHVADEGWVLRNDFDWLVPNETFEAIITASLDNSKYYQFLSKYWKGDGQPTSTLEIPPNIFLSTRNTFWKAGGYDEDFRGHYGCDMLFKKILKEVSSASIFPTVYIEAVCGGSEHSLQRDPTEAYKLLNQKLSGIKPISKDYLRFTWKRVR